MFYFNVFFFQEGETVLISASRDGHVEVVKTLLSKYANVDAVDSVSYECICRWPQASATYNDYYNDYHWSSTFQIV